MKAPETEKKCETFTSELPEKDDKINGVENQPTFTNDHIPSSQMNEHIRSSQSSGCYVEGWFDTTRAWCCVDTGACSTIMSCNFYNKLPKHQQPLLSSHQQLKQRLQRRLSPYPSCKQPSQQLIQQQPAPLRSHLQQPLQTAIPY